MQNKLLYKIQGKGTFIRENSIERLLPKLYSFSEDMRKLALSPSSRVLHKKIEEADGKVKTTLKLPNNDGRINRMVRVRLANGKPILIEKTVVPHYLCPGLLKKDLVKDSLYRILVEDYGFLLEWAEESYEASIIEAGEAQELQCENDQPVFRISRITYLKTGEPIELTHSVARGDRMRFSLQLVTDNIPLRRHLTF
ncbi:MAG: UTRA domain-containing protein [Spirochaeta sp.]|nr:UTRA domain-containing protein [Spirochaeta sp.]